MTTHQQQTSEAEKIAARKAAYSFGQPVAGNDGCGTCVVPYVSDAIIDAALCAAARVRAEQSKESVARDEIGWLVEMSDPPVYALAGFDEQWTSDASKALRFTRREDAQAWSDAIGWTSPPIRIVEHMWPHQTRSALIPAPTGVVVEGWRLMPLEPTKEMLSKAGDAFFDAAIGHISGDLDTVNEPFVRYYRAMLAAAPPPPLVGDGLREAALELADLMDSIIAGNYTPDSFTTQPIRLALASAPAQSTAEEGSYTCIRCLSPTFNDDDVCDNCKTDSDPAPAQSATTARDEVLEQIKRLPTRTELMGGQRHKYVCLDNVLAILGE